MKHKKKKQKIRKAFLKSMLIVSSLLLFVLMGVLIHIQLEESQENKFASTILTNPPSSFKKDSASPEKKPDTSQKKDYISKKNSMNMNQKDSVKEKSNKNTTLLFAGDVYFSDYVLARYNESGIQGVLSKELLKELKQADFTMVNNEFPYSNRGTQAPDKQFTFRVDPSYVSILLKSGVDIVTLANNHVLDFGADALSDTLKTLDDAGIAYTGAGHSFDRASKLISKKVNGHTFGFLAASRVFPDVSWNVENAQPGVLSAYDPSRLLSAVQDARSKCDFLCVYVHWGIERNTTPEQYQISMAHALIDAGADAVIGAHPHVLQGVEYYNGKPIFYSLGNFIFYQTIEQTAVVKLTVRNDLSVHWQLLPAKASNARTFLVTDTDECQNFYQYMSELSTNVSFTKDGIQEIS